MNRATMDSPLVKPLEAFPVKNGFRQRGIDMTRIETFTDAAFAFAVTLMVVSIDAIPTSYEELMNALLGIPAFAASFAVLMMFWFAHWAWSRRFGLEDVPTIILSCLLVFITLCYVYPLRYLFTMMMTFMSGGRTSSAEQRIELSQLYQIFVVYGTGFVAMGLVIILLNVHALRQRVPLQLSELEIIDTRDTITSWVLVMSVGVLSVVLAIVLPPSPWAIPGWTYVLLPIIMPVHGRLASKRRARLHPS